MEQKPYSNLKIAIIEDSQLLRRSIVDGLEQAGLNVVGEAKDGTEAISLIQQGQANLFIIDVVMPEASGLEIAKQIHKAVPNSRIIIMSSLNLEHIVIEAISCGAVDFIAKPFVMSDLVDSIKKISHDLSQEL
jgi:two-component system, chemotaxis family, chemotaxis protein CheY